MKLLNKTLPSYLTKIADFISLFVKDSQDVGFLDGKGSMSFSQSQSLNGSLAGIGDVKGASDLPDKAFEEKNKTGELQRSSSKQTLLPQLNIPPVQVIGFFSSFFVRFLLVFLFSCLFVWLFVWLFVCLFVCLFVVVVVVVAVGCCCCCCCGLLLLLLLLLLFSVLNF
jgi:hypothetical protein